MKACSLWPDIYRTMLRIRRTEERIATRYTEWKMRCPVHLSIGQEAAAAGVCHALKKSDVVFSSHRSHAHYIAKGGSLGAMIAELYGKENGCCQGFGGSMHLIDKAVGFMGSTSIVANSIPLSVGYGLSMRVKGESGVSVIFFGDGAVEEGAFYESVNFAIVKRLPVLFVCENNLYSVYSSLASRQPKNRRIHEMAAAMGIYTDHADGNEVETVNDVTAKALAHIRDQQGPAFLEFSTYRWREHCGPNYDDDLGYRDPQEVESWLLRDPVACYRKRVIDNSEDAVSIIDMIEKEVDKEVSLAFEFAEKSPFPPQSIVNGRVYA